MSKDTRSLNGGLDAYYTSNEYASYCCEIIRQKTFRFKIDYIVEPSAGKGSFFDGLVMLSRNNQRKIKLYDIEPKHDDIKKANFFDVELPKNTMVVGNPPFGFASSLAIKFFNHAAKYKAKIIAFILPRTFKKISVQKKLDHFYYLFYEEDCPKNCFLVDDIVYDVPCVFQIWVLSDKKRKIDDWSVENKWLSFTTPDKADFCLRRVGGRAGQVLEGSPDQYSRSSTYFCKEKVKGVKDVLKVIDFNKIVTSTAGVRSLSKREIHIQLYNYYKELNNGS